MFMDNGFSGFVSKPIDPNKLDAYLMKFIRDRQSAGVIAAVKAQHPNQAQSEAEDISNRLKEAFLRDAKNFIAVLDPIMQQDEMDSSACKIYTIQAHAMKSALANIGRFELSKAAAVLEEAGRNEDIEIIKCNTPSFLDHLHDIIKLYQTRRKDDAVDFVEDTAFINEKLLAVSAACEKYDIESIDIALSALRRTPLSRQTKEVIDQLGSHLLLSEFEEAASLARRVAKG